MSAYRKPAEQMGEDCPSAPNPRFDTAALWHAQKRKLELDEAEMRRMLARDPIGTAMLEFLAMCDSSLGDTGES